MLRRTVSGVMVAFLLMSMLTLAINIQPANAIYIRADGSVEPPTANITSVDNVTYYFTDNNYDEIVVERSNIVVDGNGYTLQGSGYGFRLEPGIGNVTVRNTTIKGFIVGISIRSSNNVISGNNITNGTHGICVDSSSNNEITGNNITANDFYGICVHGSSSYNSISGNNITNNEEGVSLQTNSFYNSVTDNRIEGNMDGVSIYNSFFNNVSGNTFMNNGWGGVILQWSSNTSIVGNIFTNDGMIINEGGYQKSRDNRVEDNFVNGKPLVYLEGVSNYSVDHGGQVILVDCDNVRVEELNLSKTAASIELLRTNNSIVAYNNVTANFVGILLRESSINSLYENNIANNTSGILIIRGIENSLYGNLMNGNEHSLYIYGPELNNYIYNSVDTSNLVDGKPVYYLINQKDMMINPATHPQVGYLALINCTNITVTGLTLTNEGEGVLLVSTTNSKIAKNRIARNAFGLLLEHSSNNTIFENEIAESVCYLVGSSGLALLSSSNNTIYHNSFINNQKQIQGDDSISANFFDNGYPSGGNYWSDYAGVDLYSGPYQNETGSDGIGDQPYGQDNYPLMGPWTTAGENTTITHASGISITFENVTSSGITVVNASQSGSTPPSGFKLASEPPIYYDIKTTASYSGAVKLSIHYNDTGLSEEEESGLQLIYWNETLQQWIDITTYVDTEDNLIIGETSHLSTFTIITPLIHDVACKKITLSKTFTERGSTVQINIIVENYGDYMETFNVTLYANTTAIDSQTIALENDGFTTISFTWNTSDFAKGNYIISVYVWPVQNETDLIDNNCTDGLVTVTWLGDLNGDFKVDEDDLWHFCAAFIDYYKIHVKDPLCDFDKDCDIDEEDLWKMCEVFLFYWKQH